MIAILFRQSLFCTLEHLIIELFAPCYTWIVNLLKHVLVFPRMTFQINNTSTDGVLFCCMYVVVEAALAQQAYWLDAPKGNMIKCNQIKIQFFRYWSYSAVA